MWFGVKKSWHLLVGLFDTHSQKHRAGLSQVSSCVSVAYL